MGPIPLLAAVVLLVQTPEQPGPVRLTYLANEGVMLSSRQGRVFIDAFFGDGLPDYAVVPRPARDSLERAAGPYGGPAIILATHAHRDHYDSAAVARYLASNPDAVAVGPPGTPLGATSSQPTSAGPHDSASCRHATLRCGRPGNRVRRWNWHRS